MYSNLFQINFFNELVFNELYLFLNELIFNECTCIIKYVLKLTFFPQENLTLN